LQYPLCSILLLVKVFLSVINEILPEIPSPSSLTTLRTYLEIAESAPNGRPPETGVCRLEHICGLTALSLRVVSA
jgi:hypothetical protein